MREREERSRIAEEQMAEERRANAERIAVCTILYSKAYIFSNKKLLPKPSAKGSSRNKESRWRKSKKELRLRPKLAAKPPKPDAWKSKTEGNSKKRKPTRVSISALDNTHVSGEALLARMRQQQAEERERERLVREQEKEERLRREREDMEREEQERKEKLAEFYRKKEEEARAAAERKRAQEEENLRREEMERQARVEAYKAQMEAKREAEIAARAGYAKGGQ